MAALSKNEVPPWGLAIAGSTGAVLANALVYPLDIVKTRLQVQIKQKKSDSPADAHTTNDRHYNGTLHAMSAIIEDEGLLGLYSGMVGSLLGVASTNFAYFYWYSTVRELYLRKVSAGKTPNTAIELSLGAVAGALAQMFTIPIAVVTTRQQTQPKHDKKGLWATAKEVIDGEDGYSGLWRGLRASLVLVVNPAITYGAYQRLREVLYPGRVVLKAHEAFLLGAMSKSLATLTTQPLIVAKVGLQSRPPPARKGVPFKSFTEVMTYILEKEGPLGLYKGIAPQLLKGLLVQGLLMMTKERMELLFVLLFRYVRKVRKEKLEQLASVAARKIEAAKLATASIAKS
ncbi:hypothetical protein LTR08_005670 [Meristemomyces frigidus]|nr:hypothetical protein LTR08_005670 [Meristemomyces frigidus]